MKARLFLVAIAIAAVLSALIAAPVSASDPSPYVATFTIHAVGPGIVAVDGSSEGYYQEESRGNFRFWGRADAGEPETVDSLELYPLIPGTVESYGLVTGSWQHLGVRYSLHACVYAAADTEGWVHPDGDFIVFGGSLPDPHPLEYVGKLWVGNQMTVVQGECGVIAATDPWGPSGTYVASVGFLVDGGVVNFVWADEPITVNVEPYPLEDIPAASVLFHSLTLVAQ